MPAETGTRHGQQHWHLERGNSEPELLLEDLRSRQTGILTRQSKPVIFIDTAKKGNTFFILNSVYHKIKRNACKSVKSHFCSNCMVKQEVGRTRTPVLSALFCFCNTEWKTSKKKRQ